MIIISINNVIQSRGSKQVRFKLSAERWVWTNVPDVNWKRVPGGRSSDSTTDELSAKRVLVRRTTKLPRADDRRRLSR